MITKEFELYKNIKRLRWSIQAYIRKIEKIRKKYKWNNGSYAIKDAENEKKNKRLTDERAKSK